MHHDEIKPSAEGRLDAAAAFRVLATKGVVTLMVEGGAELAGSILAGRLADELHAFIAPILLGPRGRPGAVDGQGPRRPRRRRVSRPPPGSSAARMPTSAGRSSTRFDRLRGAERLRRRARAPALPLAR